MSAPKALCVKSGCCIDDSKLRRTLDEILKFKVLTEQQYGQLLDTTYNALANVVSSASALRNRLRGFDLPADIEDVESVINTFSNMLNRIIEAKNIVMRILDDITTSQSEEHSKEAVEALQSIARVLDDSLISTTFVALRFLSSLDKIPERKTRGQFASAAGNALFSALLDLDSVEVMKTLKQCIDT